MNINTWIYNVRGRTLLRQNESFAWILKLILVNLIYKLLNIFNQKYNRTTKLNENTKISQL